MSMMALDQFVMPGFAADLFLNWSMLVEALGERVYANETEIVDEEVGSAALRLLKELARHMPDDIYEWNPIRIAERMTRSDEFAYCPFAYSYSNYFFDLVFTDSMNTCFINFKFSIF